MANTVERILNLRQKRLRWASRLLLYPLFILQLCPVFFSEFRMIKLSLFAVRGVAGVFAGVYCVLERKKSKAMLYILMYIGYILTDTLLHGFVMSHIVRFIAIYADIFIIFVFTEFFLTKDTRPFLCILSTAAWIGLILNALSVFLFPNGIVQVANEAGVYSGSYFYDYDNHFIVRYVPSLALIFLHERYVLKHTRGGLRTPVAIIICLSTLLYLNSSASMVAFTLILAGYLCLDWIPAKIINFRVIWIGYIAVTALLLMGSLSTAGSDVVEKLGKTSSLFRRTEMWSMALKDIAKRPLLGTGIIDSWGMRDRFGYAQLHNSLMTTLVWGGFVGAVVYTMFMFSFQRDYRHLHDEEARDFKFFTLLYVSVIITSVFDGIELLANVYLFYGIVANYSRVRRIDTWSGSLTIQGVNAQETH